MKKTYTNYTKPIICLCTCILEGVILVQLSVISVKREQIKNYFNNHFTLFTLVLHYFLHFILFSFSVTYNTLV